MTGSQQADALLLDESRMEAPLQQHTAVDECLTVGIHPQAVPLYHVLFSYLRLDPMPLARHSRCLLEILLRYDYLPQSATMHKLRTICTQAHCLQPVFKAKAARWYALLVGQYTNMLLAFAAPTMNPVLTFC